MCSTCLLLCNKPSQIQSFKITIIFFLSHSVCSFGRAQEGNCDPVVSTWALNGSWRVHLQDGSYACLASLCCCLLGSCGPLMWLPEFFTERCLGAKSTYAKTREVEALSPPGVGPGLGTVELSIRSIGQAVTKHRLKDRTKLHFLMEKSQRILEPCFKTSTLCDTRSSLMGDIKPECNLTYKF